MWIIFAILNPFAESFRNLFSKRASFSGIDPLLISWINNVLSLLVFFPAVFFVKFSFSFDYLLALFITGSINILAMILYMQAISKGDISQVIPMLSFTPLFLLITSPLIVGEFPHFWGFIGILLIVTGSYLLNINYKSKNIFSPVKAVIKNKGTRYMLIVAILWSVSANYDKVAIVHSSIWQHVFMVNLYVFSGISIVVLLRKKFSLQQIKSEKKNLFFVSLFTLAAYIFHMNALALTLVAYVVTLKRSSGMISVFLGHFFLNEPNIKERLLGSVIMFVGVVLIILA